MRKDSTLSFFEERQPDATEYSLPIIPTSPNRMPIKQLSLHSNEGSTSWAGFVESIHKSALDDAVFFLDSSFLHRREIPRETFDALLCRKVAITPRVWEELQPWVQRPFANAAFRDILVDAKHNGNSSVLFLDPMDWPEDIQKSAAYYVSLLSARKLIGLFLKESHAKELGRELSAEELTSRIQSQVGQRGAELAKKGLAEFSKPNFAADEGLVVAAVIHAILTGHETAILTRDRDPLEQFRKLIYLLDTHYRCSLISASFIDTPENLIKTEGFENAPRDFFEPGDRCVLDLPRRFTDWVISRQATPVMLYCHRFAGDGEKMKIASLHFCAQREMLSLLQAKGKCGGRNHDFPDGRNLHLAVSPPFIPQLTGNAVIGRDRVIQFGPFLGPIVDLEYALQEVQRFRRNFIDLSGPSLPGGTEGMKLADFFLRMRLMFSVEPVWQSLPWAELSKAIRFFDAAELFFLDRKVFPRLKSDVRQALLDRRFNWSTSIRDSTLTLSGTDLTAYERKAASEMAALNMQKNGAHSHGFQHYVALLAVRKLIAKIIRLRVEKEQGRECKEGEVQAIAEHYGGIRARRLADHGEMNERDPLFFAGEELMVYGLIAGILEGTDIVFITSDPVFMDQLAKLGCLLRTDYLASEYGRRHAADPMAFPIPDFTDDSTSPVAQVFGKAVGLGLGQEWRERVLPRTPYLLNLHCWLVGRDDGDSVRFAALTFCAERGMHHLLGVKGRSAGRNVDGLNGRNIRAGLNGEREEKAIVTIWNDRIIPIGAADFPMDDRLTSQVPGLPAADITRVHMNDEKIELPWFED